MRLIDADELLKSIIQMSTDGNVFDKIRNAPTIEPQKWIPASERLPEQQQTVLIQDFGQITIGYLNAENRWRNLTNLDDYLKGVDAWMPLPPAYKGEEE